MNRFLPSCLLMMTQIIFYGFQRRTNILKGARWPEQQQFIRPCMDYKLCHVHYRSLLISGDFSPFQSTSHCHSGVCIFLRRNHNHETLPSQTLIHSFTVNWMLSLSFPFPSVLCIAGWNLISLMDLFFSHKDGYGNSNSTWLRWVKSVKRTEELIFTFLGMSWEGWESMKTMRVAAYRTPTKKKKEEKLHWWWLNQTWSDNGHAFCNIYGNLSSLRCGSFIVLSFSAACNQMKRSQVRL